jgi:hypothetical protein
MQYLHHRLDDILTLTLKDAGGQKCPLDTDKACIPSIFIKTSQIFLVKADINCNFLT